MRKKSHISLAKHIVNVSTMQNFDKHKKAFYIGSILPDCRPSFLTKRHEINATFDLVKNGIERLTQGYDHIEELSTAYFTRLGEVVHYVADYFTFPHNKEYPGNMKQHCIYEGELKHKLREYIRNITESNIHNWKEKMQFEEIEQFHSVADICEFIRKAHENYIHQEVHSVEADCRYIVEVCSKIAMAILHVCMLKIEEKAKGVTGTWNTENMGLMTLGSLYRLH